MNQTQRPLHHDGFQMLQPGEGPQLLVGPQLVVGPLMMGGPLLPARLAVEGICHVSPDQKVLSRKIAADLSTICDPKTWHFQTCFFSQAPWTALAQTETAASATSADGRMGKVFPDKT